MDPNEASAMISRGIAQLSPEMREKLRQAQQALDMKKLARAFVKRPALAQGEYEIRNTFIVYAYQKGATLGQLSALFHISRATVYEKITRAMTPPEIRARTQAPKSPIEWEDLTKLWDSWNEQTSEPQQAMAEVKIDASNEDELPPMPNKLG